MGTKRKGEDGKAGREVEKHESTEEKQLHCHETVTNRGPTNNRVLEKLISVIWLLI